MHIPQDIVDLIVDQLSLSVDCETGASGHLKAASLVSTALVNRSQHHIFSTLEFDDSRKIKRWCSRIKPDPYGVSRHVRILVVCWRDSPANPIIKARDIKTALPHGCRDLPAAPISPINASDITTTLPHFTSLKNLQEFILGCTCLGPTSLSVLSPIFSSSAGTLKRLRWKNDRLDIRETWEEIRTLIDLLPNLTYVDLPGYLDYDKGAQLRFSADEAHSPATERFTFHELQIASITLLSHPFFGFCGPHLQVLDLQAFEIGGLSKRWPPPSDYGVKHLLISAFLTDDQKTFQALLEACYALQVLSVSLFPGIARLLGSIPSSYVSLICVYNPLGWGDAPMTYTNFWPWESFGTFERPLFVSDSELAEFTQLGVSIRKIAQRYSSRHPGLKTRVRASRGLEELAVRAVENDDVPLYKANFKEELGNCVDFKPILLSWVQR